jgi:hypothetical protein
VITAQNENSLNSLSSSLSILKREREREREMGMERAGVERERKRERERETERWRLREREREREGERVIPTHKLTFVRACIHIHTHTYIQYQVPRQLCKDRVILHVLHWFSKTKEAREDDHAGSCVCVYV